MNTTGTTSAVHEGRTSQILLTRGVIAILWAVAFTALAGSPTTGATVGAGVLLVFYPLIDVVGSLIDARGQDGPARRLLLANAATSAVAAVALGVSATAGVAETLAVFGVWAAVSGAAQLVVALRRRAQFGRQLPMLLAGGGAVVSASCSWPRPQAPTRCSAWSGSTQPAAGPSSSSRPGCSGDGCASTSAVPVPCRRRSLNLSPVSAEQRRFGGNR